MMYQARAFGVSVGVHAFVCCCILIAGSIIPKTKTVVLDFSIGQSSPASGRQPAQTTSAKRQIRAEQERKTITPMVKDERAVPLAQEKPQDNIPGPVSEHVVNAEQVSETTSVGPSSSEGSAEAAKAVYLSAHFLQIRDTIIRNLTYPMIARKMGWSGKVTVAFTVCTDGSVEEISIAESSGFSVLDKNALETIRKSCPLPKPPVKTALIMPVVYRLE